MTAPMQPACKGFILVVEDEPALRLLLEHSLRQRGYRVSAVPDGEQALSFLETTRPDVALLDWMMPGLSGLDLCRIIRQKPGLKDLPILFLTARMDEQDVIAGLDNGADDYLTKPCSADRLDARLRALLRRTRPVQDIITFGPLTLEPEHHQVTRNGRPVPLGPTEYRLLELFMRHPRRVFSREDLLERIWGPNVHVEIRTIDVHIRRLRKALNHEGEPDLIRTIRAAGYALEDGRMARQPSAD
ncbi:response regulator transcription factor [Bombella sp. TMW 2.2559]|uniref:Response regulator transcription factor n=1 Tax=Bombella dulcis TaxID=2967339 RepID=A0ABT3WAP9_9PROT|nr:response regulator [Bombella dulcis]MCX5616167.1 response regulator transcription factor [Bombella dulcis]